MDLFRLWFLMMVIYTTSWTALAGEGVGFGKVEEVEVLHDFPFDSEAAGGGFSERSDDGLEDSDDQDLNDLDDIDMAAEADQSEASRQQLLRKVMSAAMAKPGARQRLAQVMPILRTMSSTQRLALAGLVSSQLMAAPGAPPPPPPPSFNSSEGNITNDLMIPISMDIASMFRGLGRDAAVARHIFREDLYKRHPPYRKRPLQNHNRRNTEVPIDDMRPPPPPRVKPPKLRPNKLHVERFPPAPALPTSNDEAGADCEFFTNNLCLQISDYPMEAILKSIQNTPNKNAFEALRVDANQDFSDIFPEEKTMERRNGDGNSGSEASQMCASKVEVARPKRARATSGQWKYVVNTGDYTQTLRLEMCLKPQQSCSFLAENVKSECTQVYNYHRLLTWDHKSGLTMDIFKVPTCCSCHVREAPYPFLSQYQQATSTSMRRPVEPLRLATPPPRPPVGYGEGLGQETNFVLSEETIHRLPPTKQILNRRPPHNIPKRESRPPPRGEDHNRYHHPQYENLLRRTISRNNSEYQHLNDIKPKYHPVQPTLNQRHPELPVDNILSDNNFSLVTSVPDYQPPPRGYHKTRYPSSTPKRTIYQTTYPSVSRRPTTHQSTTPPTQPPSRRTQMTTTPLTPTSKRINYSYHPIIDFFKTSVSATEVSEDRMNNAEWTPITGDGPRLMPK